MFFFNNLTSKMYLLYLNVQFGRGGEGGEHFSGYPMVHFLARFYIPAINGVDCGSPLLPRFFHFPNLLHHTRASCVISLPTVHPAGHCLIFPTPCFRTLLQKTKLKTHHLGACSLLDK